MFWDKNDTPSQNIEALLEKENVTVEEFLEEDDIIQECKTQKKSIVNYFTRPDVIKRMIELITTEPPEDLPMAQRFRHANIACEILMLGIPSLDEKLIADVEHLNLLYSYLETEPPLNPLLASFFSKTFGLLFTKKSDQDWFLYQQLCLKLLEFLKTKNNFLDLICKHFTAPVIPDIIMDMMHNIEGGQLRRSLYDWLNEERLVEKLLDVIGDPEQCEKHANVAEFLCDLIHQGRTMRQTDQDNDSFEPIFEGSNPILKNIESATTLFALFNVILQPNALESAIVSGITVVLKIIRPCMLLDEPNSTRLKFLQARERDIHEELLSTVIRVIEPQLKHFNELIRNPPKKPDIVISAATLSPPFGKTRLQICRLFTVLLQTKNTEISKAICETDFLDIMLSLLKQYCWNNFLHSEVEKCFQTIFYTELANNNNSTQASVGSQNKQNNFGDNIFVNPAVNQETASPMASTSTEPPPATDGDDSNKSTTAGQLDATWDNSRDGCEGDITKVAAPIEPSAIQTHVIANCKVVSKLLECWQLNREAESAERGRRLGYMGHLIKIFKHITNCISESEHIGALIENNLKDDAERELWQSIVSTTDGELTKALDTQRKQLANCEATDYDISLDFLVQDDLSDVFDNMCGFTDSKVGDDVIFTLDYNTQQDSDDDNNEDDDEIDSSDSGDDNDDDEVKKVTEDQQSGQHLKNAFDLFQFGCNNDDEEDEDDDNEAAAGDSHKMVEKSKGYMSLFTQDSSDMVENCDWLFELVGNAKKAATGDPTTSEEYDNNANVERFLWAASEVSPLFQLTNNLTPNYAKNSFDYYEEDDGMWTKPLGGASSSNTDEQAHDAFAAAFNNGPDLCPFDNMPALATNQLNKSLDDDDALEDEFDTISSRSTINTPKCENNPIQADQEFLTITPPKHNSITKDVVTANSGDDKSAETPAEAAVNETVEIITETTTITTETTATSTDDSTTAT